MTPAPDSLAATLPPATQREAAHVAQDAFATIFRLTVDGAMPGRDAALAEVEQRCHNWCAAGDDAARALRRVVLVAGLDQWGLAYSQAFDLAAIPALSALLGSLRTAMDAGGEARFQRLFAQLDAIEGDAVDFKIELRRNIHLALWHAMSACDDTAEAQRIVRALGSLMLALTRRMPLLGWRLLADALASIQIRLLAAEKPVGGMAEEGTRQLFAALRQSLPPERYQAILALSGQAVLAWQQARRPAS
ncbi:MAG: hypothetical protein HZT41_11035 [Dechloromonas sp.]|nr:MAG: hypothetical protein HZT41_11035 [Dechloromonas sp.]